MEAELADLDKEMQAPDFWDDPAKSAPLLKKRRAVERQANTLKQLRTDSEELETWRELLAEGEADDEVVEFADRLEQELQELELQLKLGGPDDASDALVAIHPGAGGTESQDWADMLLRMYLRYCEAHDLKTQMLDYQAGEEAGIKSVTFAVRGQYSFGYLKSEASTGWCASRRSTLPAAGTRPSRRSTSIRRSTTRSRSTSPTRTCGLTPTARPEPAASTSTSRIRRCASPICRPISW